MIYTLKLDQTALQVLGEALAIAPMAMRVTQPVLAAIQQQVSQQEAEAAAPKQDDRAAYVRRKRRAEQGPAQAEDAGPAAEQPELAGS